MDDARGGGRFWRFRSLRAFQSWYESTCERGLRFFFRQPDLDNGRLSAPGFLTPLTRFISGFASLFVSAAIGAEPDRPGQPKVFAFYFDQEPSSRTALREHLPDIGVLLPRWLHLSNASGSVESDDSDVTADDLDFIRAARPDLTIVPVVSNLVDGSLRADWANAVLQTERSRQKLVSGLLSYVASNGLQGIAVDFEGLTVGNGYNYDLFAGELAAAFKPGGLKTYHVVALGDVSRPTENIAAAGDGVILVGHNQADTAAPPAAESWYRSALQIQLARIPASKLIVGLSNLAVDWTNPGNATVISVPGAMKLAGRVGAHWTLEPTSKNVTFDYVSGHHIHHRVWVLDAVTAYNELRMALPSMPQGVALWRLGAEDPSVWSLLRNLSTIEAAGLSKIDAPYQVDTIGAGEVIQVAAGPHDGRRSVSVSANGNAINSERISSYPNGYRLMQWGGTSEKLLALTFDDGPDPTFTSQVLDALKLLQAPATFFEIGGNMVKYPELVRRIVQEGHEVGSHTFNHTNIAQMSDQWLRLDLNATQEVFNSITGRNMVLFRPPYLVDANPQTPDEIRPLATVSEMGYFSVNANIDSEDWKTSDASEIVDGVLAGVAAKLGNIILMHDGGGDRTATVTALPVLIGRLRSEGYRLVTVSELLNKTADDVMPLSSPQNIPQRFLQWSGFTLLRAWDFALPALYFIAILLGTARTALLIVFSFLERKREAPHDGRTLSVGVIVPAYNEAKVVLKTVRSLLGSSYSGLKILVVDDGSSDDTYELCRTAFAEEETVAVITKPNGGKSDALNFGLRQLDTEIVVALDADTVFLPDTISMLVARLSDKRVGAVAGNAKVGNRVNLLTKFQALEYITSQNLDRRAFDYFNCITVVPGAVGAWRRDVVIEAGGFTTDTLAEDADLTIRILRNGHEICYAPEAVALTEAPETLADFLKQRHRWAFGMMQVAGKHFGALLMKDSVSVGTITMPNILFFQIFFPVLAPVLDLVALMALWTIVTSAWGGPMPSQNYGTAIVFLITFVAFVTLDYVAAVVAFWHERSEDRKLLALVIPQRFIYRQLNNYVVARAVLAAVRGRIQGWGTLARTAGVSDPKAVFESHTNVAPR